jgi:hypothetical protein
MLFLFTKYRSLTLLSFESFHIGLVREMFTPRQSTVNDVTRGIRRSIPMMRCGLLSNLLCIPLHCFDGFRSYFRLRLTHFELTVGQKWKYFDKRYRFEDTSLQITL